MTTPRKNIEERKIPMKILKTLAVAGLTMAALISPANPASANAPVNQGDTIYAYGTVIGNSIYYQNDCAVGYVTDTEAWVAAHCANNGAEVFNEAGYSIGVMRHLSPTNGTFSSMNDVGYIELSSPAGSNRYSGNALAYTIPVKGDEVCMYTRNTRGTQCGVVTYTAKGHGNDMIQVSGVYVSQGDSGGPAWVPGVGFIGSISSTVVDNSDVQITYSAPFMSERTGGTPSSPSDSSPRGSSSSSSF